MFACKYAKTVELTLRQIYRKLPPSAQGGIKYLLPR